MENVRSFFSIQSDMLFYNQFYTIQRAYGEGSFITRNSAHKPHIPDLTKLKKESAVYVS